MTRPVRASSSSPICSTRGTRKAGVGSTATVTARSTRPAPPSSTRRGIDLANAWAEPVLGDLTADLADTYTTFDAPPGGQYSGWHIYMDKDLRSLLGEPVKGTFKTRFCGGGDLEACRTSLWAALDRDGRRAHGRPRPRPRRVAFVRGRRTDQVRPRAAPDDDGVHEPPERHPAGDQLRRPSTRELTRSPRVRLAEIIRKSSLLPTAGRRTMAA